MDCSDGSCNPWRRKNSGEWNYSMPGLFDFEEFADRIFRDMEELMRASPQDNTLVRGFTMVIEGGEPIIREFGNVNPQMEDGVEIERKPLIDVMKDDDAVTVIAEMPGVEKEDIDIKASETHVEISAEREDRKYSEKVDLGCKVIPDSHKARYNNGVLEIVFKRREDKEEEMKKVNVE